MAFLIGGANTLTTGDLITNSCQFNLDAHCEFTPSSGSGSTQFTMSAWIKNAGPGGVSEDGYIISGKDADNGLKFLSGSNNGKMQFIEYDGGDNAYYIRTNRLFRDPSAWFHVVLIYDAPDGTAGDRMRLYINGTRETSWAAEVQLPQNRANAGFTRNNVPIRVGANASGSNARFNGYLADVHFCDGQNYEPSEFGETDDNGVWVPKKTDLSYGTNGFRLEFKETGTSANSSGIGADTSGNDNHFAVTKLAATNITTDTPQNNFCTYNPLATPSSLAQYGTFSEGNTTYTGHSNGSYGSSATGTFGVASGKWYWESKLTTALSNGIGTGIRDIAEWNPDWANDSTFNHTDAGGDGGYAYNYNNGKPQRNNAESTTNQGSAVSQNDIVMHAMDLDNGALYYGINGTWQASSDPTSGASKTNAQHSFTVAGVYAPAAYSYSSRAFATNFGNPSFAISSGNADANGYGNFEYAVPSGYYSLCTKNLAEYG